MKTHFCTYLALAFVLASPFGAMAATPVALGSAGNFAILAGSAITSTGGGTVDGNVGLSPTAGTAITGLTAAKVSGFIYTMTAAGPAGSVEDAARLTAAKNDLTTAFTNTAGLPADFTVATELGGSTKTPGVYDSASGTFGITGILTLDGGGDPDAVFIFKMGTTLTSAASSAVILTNGAQARNVFWLVGTSATLGGSSTFIGIIMADQSITMAAGSLIEGRMLARAGQVTFDSQRLVEPPTLAVITAVRSRIVNGVVVISWEVALELETAGYFLDRWTRTGWHRVNADLIYPQYFAQPPLTYSQVDATAPLDTTQRYRIIELDHQGRLLPYGPYEPVLDEDDASTVSRLAEPVPEAAVALMEAPTIGPAVKVPVASNDVYAVSFASIAAGLDLPADDVADRAGMAMLAMRCGNAPVAYLVDADRILFYGWGAASTYTKTNIFWIEPGNGLHIRRTAPDPVPVSSNLTFTSTMTHEADLAIMTERGILRDDLYFWKSFVAGHVTNGERTFDVPLDGYAGGDLTVTVHLLGWNDTPLTPDHQADVLINNELLGSIFFDGKEEASASFTVPAGNVLPAGNILKVRAILQAGHVTSLFVLDRFDVAYTRYYAPVPALLQASDGGNGRMGADRFASPLVFDVTDPWQPVWIADASDIVPAGYSWQAPTGTQWALREQDTIALLPSQPGGLGTWMRAVTNAVDYLVIAPRAFEASANALANYRAGQGLRTAVALYEDICDQFADGLSSPESIRTLLAYTRQYWAAAPWMVVLGGWGHYDYLGATTATANPLPPLLASDSATLRPADSRFADLTGDEVPDLAIGRIPVQSVTQFNAYIAKVMTYEADGPQASYGQALFAADNIDDGGDFTASNLDIATETKAGYALAFTTLDSNTVASVRADIMSAFTNSVGIIHYTGHGSYQQLAGENLLHVNDVNAMVNPPVPLFISLTCLIGRFDMLNTRSLAETLVLRAGGGALAVYAPSGLSWNAHAAQFGKTFYRVHAADRCNTIGLALLQTRQSIGEQTGTYAVSLRTYNLLGDPALKLRGGQSSGVPAWVSHYSQWRWERFTTTELLDPDFSGSYDAPSGTGTRYVADYIFGTQLPCLQIQASVLGNRISWPARWRATDVEYRLLTAPDPWGPWGAVEGAGEIAFSETAALSLWDASLNISPSSGRSFFKLEANLK